MPVFSGAQAVLKYSVLLFPLRDSWLSGLRDNSGFFLIQAMGLTFPTRNYLLFRGDAAQREGWDPPAGTSQELC